MMASTTLPRTVWILGLVSLFMDMSSEFIHALLPIYLTASLGLTVMTVSIVEGIAQATASFMKVFSGYISDLFHKRKVLLLTGYGLATLSKPIFPLANGVTEIVTARLIDRVGKGIRGAPRDALLADVTPVHALHKAYGVRQSLDMTGAFAGPLLAILALYTYSHDLKLVMWIAVIPALVCVGLIIWGIRDPVNTETLAKKPRIHWKDMQGMPSAYWLLLALTAVVTLARMTDALLILKAQENQLPVLWIPLVLVVYSAVYAASVWPVGVMAERMGQNGLLLTGMVMLALSQYLLSQASDTGWLFWTGIALWGLHMGMTQGLLTARVAHFALPSLRGTAFGLFHLMTGVAQLLAGLLFGWLWLTYSASLAFEVAACISLLSLPLLWVSLYWRR